MLAAADGGNLLVDDLGGVHGVLHRRDGPARRHGHGVPVEEHDEECDHGGGRRGGRESRGGGGWGRRRVTIL